MSAAWLPLSLNAKGTRYAAIAFAIAVTLILLFRIGHTTGQVELTPYHYRTGQQVPVERQRSLQPIQNATLGFEGILAINLPERTDHRDGLVLASAVSNIHIDFVDGVHGDKILDKVLPPKQMKTVSNALKGSWRAHVNAIRRVIENDWSTALIMEDDVDWDIRIKTQLQDIALSTAYVLRSNVDLGILHMKDVSPTHIPKTSPYGDDWDVIWLGHCGMDLPEKGESTVVLMDDETVAETQYQKSWDIHAVSPMVKFPNHTRAATAPIQGTCSLAYAVSQRGARQLLRTLGLNRFDAPFDIMLREWCQGSNGHQKHNCVGVLPQLFDHHRRVGPNEIDSDISAPNDEVRTKAFTNNIRWSVRMNMDKLLTGDMNYDDQYPDTP